MELGEIMQKGVKVEGAMLNPATDVCQYTPEIGEEICVRLMGGETLKEISEDPRFPNRRTVARWLHRDAKFRENYISARQVAMEIMGEELIEIADDTSNDYMERERHDGSFETVVNHENINRSRLRVDARKWLMAKLAPSRFADAPKPDGSKENPLHTNAKVTAVDWDAIHAKVNKDQEPAPAEIPK